MKKRSGRYYQTMHKKGREISQPLSKKLVFNLLLVFLSFSKNSTNSELLGNKVKEPSRSIELISLKEQSDLLINLITQANTEIKKHNDIVTNFATERSNLIKAIWRYLIEEYKVAGALADGLAAIKKEVWMW